MRSFIKDVLKYGIPIWLLIVIYNLYMDNQEQKKVIDKLAYEKVVNDYNKSHPNSVLNKSKTSNSSSASSSTGDMPSEGAQSTDMHLKAEVTLEEIYTDLRYPNDDGTYPMVMKVKIKNLDSRSWLANPRNFTLSTAEGDTSGEDLLYTRVINGVEQKKLELLDLVPNQSTEGWISFTVNKSKQYTLTYKYDNASFQIPFSIPSTNNQVDINKNITKTIIPYQ